MLNKLPISLAKIDLIWSNIKDIYKTIIKTILTHHPYTPNSSLSAESQQLLLVRAAGMHHANHLPAIFRLLCWGPVQVMTAALLLQIFHTHLGPDQMPTTEIRGWIPKLQLSKLFHFPHATSLKSSSHGDAHPKRSKHVKQSNTYITYSFNIHVNMF